MHFVNLHGGSVGVSTGPSGSTFTVSLPMDQPPKA
jgi:signal transduction histidine kinase